MPPIFPFPTFICCCKVCGPAGGIAGLSFAMRNNYWGCQCPPSKWLRCEYRGRSWLMPIALAALCCIIFLTTYLPITFLCARLNQLAWKLIPTCPGPTEEPGAVEERYTNLGGVAIFAIAFTLVGSIASAISTLWCAPSSQDRREDVQRQLSVVVGEVAMDRV